MVAPKKQVCHIFRTSRLAMLAHVFGMLENLFKNELRVELAYLTWQVYKGIISLFIKPITKLTYGSLD